MRCQRARGLRQQIFQMCVGAGRLAPEIFNFPRMGTESEDSVSTASGDMPAQAEVSPDRHQVSHTQDSGTGVASIMSPRGPVGITPGSSVSHSSWMTRSFQLPLHCPTFLLVAAFRQPPLGIRNASPWVPLDGR